MDDFSKQKRDQLLEVRHMSRPIFFYLGILNSDSCFRMWVASTLKSMRMRMSIVVLEGNNIEVKLGLIFWIKPPLKSSPNDKM